MACVQEGALRSFESRFEEVWSFSSDEEVDSDGEAMTGEMLLLDMIWQQEVGGLGK
jgi:hypothetical protein